MGDRYRYTGGRHTRADGETIEQGGVFEPTEREKEKVGDLLEPVSSSAPVQGADIGVRAIPMTSAAKELAEEALREGNLSEEDFEGVEPEGADGDYLKPQVAGLIEEG